MMLQPLFLRFSAKLLGLGGLSLAAGWSVPALAGDPLTQEAAIELMERSDPMAQARAAVARRDPAEALGRFLRVLTRAPRDLEALTGAGKAALDIGDPTAALGFYAQAEAVAPRNARVKAGLGSTMVQMENPRAALRFFDDAIDYGMPVADIAADRGLAYDLRGDTRRAQADYALALRSQPDPETIRRLALSQAMAGDRAAALQTLDPLLRKQDIPAWRARAFVFALTGDAAAAEKAAAAVMPRGQAEALAPYLARIATLKDGQKAAAVHFGHFPSDGRPPVQLASNAPVAQPPIAQPPVAGATLVPSGAPLGRGDGGENEPAKMQAKPVSAAPPKPVVAMPAKSAPVIPEPLAKARPTESAKPVKVEADKPAISPIRFALAEPAKAAETPAPAVKKPIDAPAPEKAKAGSKEAGLKAADAKSAKDKAAREAAKPDTKDIKGKSAKAQPERYWVQVAGGANKDMLPRAWAALKSKWPKQLGGQTPSTMAYRATNRLLIGPFKSSAEAQAFVNAGAKDGLSSFAVTSKAGEEVEKLTVK